MSEYLRSRRFVWAGAVAVALCMLFISCVASDESEAASANTVAWSFDESTGKLIVSYEGDMPSYGTSGPPWDRLKGTVVSLEINGNATSISARAFEGMAVLVSVTLPSSLQSISDYAFYNCSSLRSVTLPDNVSIIGTSAFQGCGSLETFMLGSITRLAIIGDAAFQGTGLAEFHFPASLYSIGDRAFKDSKLASVVFDYGVNKIGENCFRNTSLTDVTLPDSLTEIGKYALMCSTLRSIHLGNGVTSVSELAKYSLLESFEVGPYFTEPVIYGTVCYVPPMCTTLPSVSITFGNIAAGYTYYYTYGAHFDTGYKSSFYYGTTLDNYCITEFIADPANSVYSSYGGVLYDKDMKTLVMYPNAKEDESFVIPTGVIYLGKSCLAHSNLRSLTIPDTVVSIDDFAIKIDDGELTVPSSVAYLGFRSLSAPVLNLNCSVDTLMWYNTSTSVKVINLGKGVHSINQSVDVVYLVDANVDVIHDPDAFKLKVAVSHFQTVWPHLKEMNVDHGNKFLSSINGIIYSADGKRLIYVPSQTEIRDYEMPGSVEYINSGSPPDIDRIPVVPFTGRIVSSGIFENTKIRSVVLSENLINIGDAAFFQNTFIQSVKIPSSVIKIGERAFEGCSSLTSVYFEGKIPQLGLRCFTVGTNNSPVQLSVYADTDSTEFLDKCTGAYSTVTYHRVDAVSGEDGLEIDPTMLIAVVVAGLVVYAVYIRYRARSDE